MANCKSCGTRVGQADRHCPNCGRTTSPGGSLTGMTPLPDPGDSGVQTSPPEESPDSKPAPKPEPKPEPISELTPDPTPPPKSVPELKSEPKPTPRVEPKPAPKAKEKSVPKTESAVPEVELSEPEHEVTGALASGLGAEAMRTRLVDDPELVEPGLVSYRDPKTGAPAGAEYSTEVGTIDLLAEDSDGALVVVLVSEAGSDPVGPVLEQLGWISKHLATKDRSVRAIVLLEPPAPELGYAARAVADTVAFKTWRVAIAVDDVEV